MNRFFLTTAIDYPNGRPHMGHALEKIEADMMARYHRLLGKEVFFLTGTDEHGTKIFESAQKEGITPQEYCDRQVQFFKNFKTTLDISYDYFVRTTDAQHERRAQLLWSKLAAAGDLYKQNYRGLYCAGCEAFVLEKDLENGACPLHPGTPVTVIEEENYFFRLSKYADQLKSLLEQETYRVFPEFRRNEILALIDRGLTDVSFSRPKTSLPWGIPVPDDPEHVMYVWCDALSNYITAVGYGEDDTLFQQWWPADVHMVGKDITRFHALIWPAMLLSAQLPLPKQLFVHEFVTSGGRRMSKSAGNGIEPSEVIDRYGKNALRFFLAAETPLGKDVDFTWERLHDVYHAVLVNSVGNLARRVTMLSHKYWPTVPSYQFDSSLITPLADLWTKYDTAFQHFDWRTACQAATELSTLANQFLNTHEPWKLFATDPDRVADLLGSELTLLQNLAGMLLPIIPEPATQILQQLGISSATNRQTLLETSLVGKTLTVGEVLFPKIEIVQ